MAEKIFCVYLAKDGVPYNEAYAKLDLPATPWELWDVLDKLRLRDGEILYMEIDDYYAFEYLAPHLEKLDINSECKTIIKLSDTDLLQSITNILNRLISQPDIIEMSIDTNEVGNDIRRLNMEIAHALETCSFNKEDLRKKMLTCVSLKYKGIDSATYTANRLKADFEKSSPLSAFSAELCRRTVKSIQLKTDGTVGLTLINDQQIGKEKAS